MGVGGDRGLQVQGVGQVDLCVDRTVPATPSVGEPDVEVAPVGGGQALGLGLLGVEPGLGLLDQPCQLRGPDLVRHRRDMVVDERRRGRGQALGAVGDEPQPPRRQVTGHQPGPAAPQPVVALDHLGQVAAPGLGGTTHRGRELHHRELRHLRTPLPTQRKPSLVPRLRRPDQRLTAVHRGPPGSGLHHLTGIVVLGPLALPRIGQHGGGVIAPTERERVEGRGHRGTNPTTQHRHRDGPGSPLWTTEPGTSDVHRNWSTRGSVPRRLR